MTYRNGTYVAFHANGTNRPGGKSDIDYYNLMKAWAAKTDDDFTMINSHEKASAVRDTSAKATLQASLMERLRNSKNMVLIIGDTTKLDDDWVPFEIIKAVDVYEIPIIATYTDIQSPILNAASLRARWPQALKERIDNKTASVIHVPFRKAVLHDAISQFSHNVLPKNGGLSIYGSAAYMSFGMA